MKFTSLTWAVLASTCCAITLPTPTDPLSQVTDAPLVKRLNDAKVNKDFQKLKDQKSDLAMGLLLTEDLPKPWVYTNTAGNKEIITPEVYGLVTFYLKPPKVDADLQPWYSLDKQGQAKVKTPKRGGDGVKNGLPTYGTWFAVPTTETHEIDGEMHEIDTHIEEDEREHMFDRLMRCTPELYGKRGVAKDKSTEPFCNPVEEKKPYLVNTTYFITWYLGFFKDEENEDKVAGKVKIHLNHVKESTRRKGLRKRDLFDEFAKRSVEVEYGAKVDSQLFFVSDWVLNTRGWYPLEIDEEWLGKDEQRFIMILIQPDYMSDEDFNHMDRHAVIPIRRMTIVAKEDLQDVKKMEQKQANRYLGIHDEDEDHMEKYYVMFAIPTCVMLAALGMYLFVFINRKQTDLSGVKRRTYARDKTTRAKLPWKKKLSGYSELPQFQEGGKHD